MTAGTRSPLRRSLPSESYTSQQVFSRERERIFDRSWLYAGHASSLVTPGDYVLLEAAGESLIVLRSGRDGDSESIRAFFNVCRHRGSRLCESERGTLKGSIVCPYHAWTYGLDGGLLAARNMAGVEDFDPRDYPLHSARDSLAGGLVFANLAQSVAPQPSRASDLLRPLAAKLERWDVARLGVARTLTYELACNWKLVFQNYSECYHCPVIHPQLEALSPWDSGTNDCTAGPVLGGPMELRPVHATMSLSGASGRRPLGAVDGEDLRRVYYYTVWPSLLLSLHPDYVMTHRVLPLTHNRTKVVCDLLFAPEVLSDPGFDPSDVAEFWDRTNRQDWHACELTQLGVSSREYVAGPYSPYEKMLAAFDAFYIEQMA